MRRLQENRINDRFSLIRKVEEGGGGLAYLGTYTNES